MRDRINSLSFFFLHLSLSFQFILFLCLFYNIQAFYFDTRKHWGYFLTFCAFLYTCTQHIYFHFLFTKSISLLYMQTIVFVCFTSHTHTKKKTHLRATRTIGYQPPSRCPTSSLHRPRSAAPDLSGRWAVYRQRSWTPSSPVKSRPFALFLSLFTYVSVLACICKVFIDYFRHIVSHIYINKHIRAKERKQHRHSPQSPSGSHPPPESKINKATGLCAILQNTATSGLRHKRKRHLHISRPSVQLKHSKLRKINSMRNDC